MDNVVCMSFIANVAMVWNIEVISDKLIYSRISTEITSFITKLKKSNDKQDYENTDLSNRKARIISFAQKFVFWFCQVIRCASRVAPDFSEGIQPDVQDRVTSKIAYMFML
jgi:hypothetical protein